MLHVVFYSLGPFELVQHMAAFLTQEALETQTMNAHS